MKMPLLSIVLDDRIYPRSKVNDFNIVRLAMALQTGAIFPPLIICADSNRLVDGRHRYEALMREGIETADVTKKVYNSEADLFADAVRYNATHGQALDTYTIRNAVIRLTEYGYTKDQISEVIRMPTEQIEKMEKGFAQSNDGSPIALKGGLNHLGGAVLSENQIDVNRRYSGGKAVFYVRQICELLQHNMWPQTETFSNEMSRLVEIWENIASKKTAA